MLITQATRQDESQLLILGISEDNWRRMVCDYPLSLKVMLFGKPLDLILFAGATDQAMQDELERILAGDRSDNPAPAAGGPDGFSGQEVK